MRRCSPFYERARRLWAATEAHGLGYRGVALVARATGLTRDTLSTGLQNLTEGIKLPVDRVRQTGGGRRMVDKDSTLWPD
ncbi:MAG: hypothetical protein M1493_14150 [Firmicutes bacterium]|jgi:hypothetical protein|nr:hypothetical protein [Bacillota bacterium]